MSDEEEMQEWAERIRSMGIEPARNEMSGSELPEPVCSTPTPLFVSARIYNEPGLYRVLEIGIEHGHRNNSYDVAKLLRKIADWVEKEKA